MLTGRSLEVNTASNGFITLSKINLWQLDTECGRHPCSSQIQGHELKTDTSCGLQCRNLEFILNFHPPQKVKIGMWSWHVTVTWHNWFLVYLGEINLYLCPSRWLPRQANRKKTTIPDTQRWTEMRPTWTGFLRRPWSRYPTGDSLHKRA